MKYRVLVTRDVTESAVIDVEAESKILAADLAIDIANGTVESSSETRWETNEIGDASAYLGDCVEEDVRVVKDDEWKPKCVLVSVRCANDFVGVPQVFYCEISERLANRIKALSNEIKAHGAYAIEEFDYHGLWSDGYIDERDIDESNWRSSLSELEKLLSRVEIPKLRVTESDFHWTSVPKHADDSLALTTNRIPVAFLDNTDEVYIDI